MKNLRRRRPFITKDFTIVKNRDQANAVMRAYGNSKSFPWSTLTRDLEVAKNLGDVSLLYFQVEDDKVIEIINSFEYDELIFSRSTGETSDINPTGCLINKNDIWHCYEKYKNETSCKGL